MSVVRSAGLRGLAGLVRERGADPVALAARAGLPPEALAADDLLVPDAAAAAVLELAAEELDVPDLGLRVAARQDLGMLGPLAVAIQNSPTVADALECTSRYLFVHARSLSLTLEPDPYGDRGVRALRYGTPPGAPAPVQATDLGLGFLHRAIQSLVGERYGLRTVELPYRPAAATEVHEAFFGVPVRVLRPAAALRVPVSLAGRPLTGGDEGVRRQALAFLAAEAAAAGPNLAPRVRSAVARSLGTGPVGIAEVASLLALHPRTLQRRLAEEGTTFGQVVDGVRRETAHRFLTTTDLPLSQVAGLVGLSEQSALTRSSRRWWGRTPTAVRSSRGQLRFD